MWRLADREIDEFIGQGECEFITEYAEPVHPAGHRRPARRARRRPRRRFRAAARRTATQRGSAAREGRRWSTSRSSSSTSGSRAYIEDRRRRSARRRDDRAGDRDLPRRVAARGRRRRCAIAANLFAAGGRPRPGSWRDVVPAPRRRARPPAAAARRARPHPELHRGDAAAREPDQGRLPAVAGRRRPSAASTSRPAPP